MKKLMYLVLALMLVLSLCACGSMITEDKHTHDFGENSEEKPVICSCGALNELAWKNALQGENLHSYTVNVTQQVTQTTSDTNGDFVQISNQTATYRFAEKTGDVSLHIEAIEPENEDSEYDIQTTVTVEEYAQTRQTWDQKFFCFDDCYDKFQFNVSKKIYELKEPCQVTISEYGTPIVLEFSACELTFSEDGRLTKMVFKSLQIVKSDDWTMSIERDGEYVFCDYETTVIPE